MKVNKRKYNLIFSYGCNIRNLLILLIILVSFVSFSQNNPDKEIKELKSKLNTSHGDEKIRIMLSLWYQYFAISADSSLSYAQNSLKLSLLSKNDTLIGRSYYNLGTSYMVIGNDKKSKEAFKNAVVIFSKNKDSIHLANSYSAIGQYYFFQSDYTRSLNFYFKALVIYYKLQKAESYENAILVLNGISAIYREQKNYNRALFYLNHALKIADGINDNGFTTSNLYISMATVYLGWKQNKKAIDYYKKAYRIDKTINNPSCLAYTMNDIGNVYYNIKQYDSSYYYYSNAKELFKKINDDKGISYSNQNIGNIYRDKKDYSTALNYYNNALSGCEKNTEQSRIASILYEIGRLYFTIKSYNKAKENSFRSLTIAKSIKYKESIYENYLLLSDIYTDMDSCDIAFKYYKLYSVCKDSIFNMEVHGEISEMQEKYESDKREKTIKILTQDEEIQDIKFHKQRIFKNSLLGTASLLLIIAFVTYRNYRNKRKANIIIAAEKDKSDNLLMNILPEETAEELKREGFAKTRYYEHVTILFTDFKGFTLMAEKLTPEKLVAELDYCFKAFDAIIEKYPIEKIKTIGDSYMCAGGLPVPNTTNPNDIVNCGLEICRFMQEYIEERKKQEAPYFEIRIGIHTGSVISGIVGTKKFAYDIWGDAVNVAAHMESSGTPGFVNISGDTYNYVKDNFVCIYRGKIEAKNKGLVDMYFVEGVKSNETKA